jgi:hypothetical protein
MKKCGRAVLFWSLGIYALSAMILNVVMDRWCPAPYEKVYRIKREGLYRLAEEEPDRSLVVMLGSSRTEGAFQGGQIDGFSDSKGRPLQGYNFGVPAAGPIHEYLYLLEMLERGIRPRLLLVEFLPPLFNDAHGRLISEEKWTAPAWTSASQLIRLSPYLVHPVRKKTAWIQARLAPWCTYRAHLHGWFMKQLLPPPSDTVPVPYPHDRWGCRLPEPLTAEESSRRWMMTQEYVPSLQQFRLGQEPVRAMYDLLQCCRDEKIPVVLVITPESTVFRSWYSASCRAVTRNLLAELRATYGVEVIDTTEWLDDDDFMDGHHVAASGAQKFTARLLVEVQHVLR